MIHLVKQKYSDDCCVAACSMSVDVPYSDVLAAAERNGYIPDNDKGIPIDNMLSWIGFNCEITQGFYCPNPDEPVLLCIKSQYGTKHEYHAVMVYQGKVYDPNGKLLGANLRYCVRNTLYTYWNITAFKN